MPNRSISPVALTHHAVVIDQVGRVLSVRLAATHDASLLSCHAGLVVAFARTEQGHHAPAGPGGQDSGGSLHRLLLRDNAKPVACNSGSPERPTNPSKDSDVGQLLSQTTRVTRPIIVIVNFPAARTPKLNPGV
jgi:hypothetical protein